MRYDQLINLIDMHKPAKIVETGTWNGLRAVQMCLAALEHHDRVTYVGFDLFEDGDEKADKRELNVKRRTNRDEVFKTLKDSFGERVDIHLVKGDTRETLKASKDLLEGTEFAFIDGGHSVKTIRNDFGLLKDARVVVLDDYYQEDAEGKSPDTKRFGVNALIGKEITDFAVLPQADPVRDGGTVSMIVTPSSAAGRQQLLVKTKNCVEDSEILDNIRYAMSLDLPYLPQIRRHDRIAVFCSGGPSLEKNLPAVKALQHEGAYVFCVKHAHDTLIDNGIVPWGCVLLDPRDHVQDFVENPHPDVLYMVASMCHPTTLDQLLKYKASVILYHAHVGSGEEKVVKEHGGGLLIGGGCSTAMRSVSILHSIGFWRLRLFGYDLQYEEEPDWTKKKSNGDPEFIKVMMNGKEFWTDAEKVAQGQDFGRLMENEFEFEIEAYGDGMIPHILQTMERRPRFEDVFGNG